MWPKNIINQMFQRLYYLISTLGLSALLSTFYALVMMAVIVGTALQLGEDGIGSPSAIFLISLSGSFFIAACLHPQEFWCVVPGMLCSQCPKWGISDF